MATIKQNELSLKRANTKIAKLTEELKISKEAKKSLTLEIKEAKAALKLEKQK